VAKFLCGGVASFTIGKSVCLPSDLADQWDMWSDAGLNWKARRDEARRQGTRTNDMSEGDLENQREAGQMQRLRSRAGCPNRWHV
jgi:hypothetical protein